MALDAEQQIKTAIQQCRHLLVTFPADYTLDGLGSAIALSRAALHLRKPVTLACDDFQWPSQYPFLPQTDIRSSLAALQQFQINVKLGPASLGQLSYTATPTELTIVLSPKSGTWTDEDVTTETISYQYDLICVVDAPDRPALGSIFSQHRDFFFRTPTVNIDRHPGNEGFGQYQYTDVTAPATAQLVYRLLRAWEMPLDAATATCLLAGIIAATRSFRDPRTTPDTLAAAAVLVGADADRAGIIRALYRSTQLSTLQLWGRILARLKSDDERRVVWAVVTETDFAESGTNPDSLGGVLDDLVANLPTAQVAAVLYAQGSTVRAIVRTYRSHDARTLVAPLPATGMQERVTVTFADATLAEAETQLTTRLREALAREE